MEEKETFASFWGHMEGLRRTFLKIAMTIGCALLLCFIFHDTLFSFLKKPLDSLENRSIHKERLEYYQLHPTHGEPQLIQLLEAEVFIKELSYLVEPLKESTYQILPGGSLVYAKKIPASQLILLSPLEGILSSIKISFWVAIFVSSPLWLFFLAKFLLPGLRRHERQLVIPFMTLSLLFILLGCFFAYAVTIPLANQYLTAFNASLGTTMWSLENYLDYSLFLLLANGIAFELTVIALFAVHVNLISAENLKTHRRFAYLGAFILAALLTPPDILTQWMLAIPLICLYEGVIAYAQLRLRFTHTYVD